MTRAQIDVMAQRALSVADPVSLGMNDSDRPLSMAHGYVSSVDEPWIDAVLNLNLAPKPRNGSRPTRSAITK